MKNEQELYLYLVSNPTLFERYEDHEAALQLRLYELVDSALLEKESPVALMEDYLGLVYTGGSDVDSIVHFLMHTPHVQHAHHRLRDHWSSLDRSLPAMSLRHGGTTRAQARQVFETITLRSYLEVLSGVFN